jgi:hypothetical protein
MSNVKSKVFIIKLKFMRGYFGLGQLSAEEKSDILDKHRHVYDGYRTMQPEVSNQQPLYVHDFAGDKDGMVVNNKGEVKKYTNMGINEQVEQKEVCDECGAMMMEGMCTECNYGHMEEHEEDGDPQYHHIYDPHSKENMEEETGHLDDIYHEEDLNPTAGFDYIEGSSNDKDTFKKSHKNLYREQDIEDPDNENDGFEDINSSEMSEEDSDEKPYEKGKMGMKASRTRATFEPTPKEKDIIAKLFGEYGNDIPPIVIRYLRKLPRKVLTKRLMDLNLINSEGNKENVTEQGFTGGGNAPDMDLSNIDPAYNFESDGPMAGGDVYNTESIEEDDTNSADYEPMTEDDMFAYEPEMMESAWSEEMDEVDVSGVQGIYGGMEKAYDFDSDGPGKAGPYQQSQYEGETDEQFLPPHVWKHAKRKQDAEKNGEDFDSDEFHPSDYEDYDLDPKSDTYWEDIKGKLGDWEEVDEDLKESFFNQKNKIMEMFNRVNKY